MRLYRIAAQVFLVSLTVLIGYFVLSARADYANFVILGLIVCTSYLSVTYFADLHSDAAEGLLICYLTEQNCEGPNM